MAPCAQCPSASLRAAGQRPTYHACRVRCSAWVRGAAAAHALADARSVKHAPTVTGLRGHSRCPRDLSGAWHAAALLAAAGAAAQAPLELTTSGGVIMDGTGAPVVFKGIGWFGFNTGCASALLAAARGAVPAPAPAQALARVWSWGHQRRFPTVFMGAPPGPAQMQALRLHLWQADSRTRPLGCPSLCRSTAGHFRALAWHLERLLCQ